MKKVNTSSFEPIVSPTELHNILIEFIKRKLPLFILGDPGQGKTQITRQAAAELKADFVPIFLAIKDPTDIGGIPSIVTDKKGDKGAEFLPFGDMKKLLNAKKLTVCFADDLGPAAKLMQAAWMQCVCEREINGHKISKHVVFISASNLKGGNTGVSTILDPLMNKHVTVVQLKNRFEDWCKWAVKKGLPYEIVYFVRWRPKVLRAYKPMNDLSQTPTARGLEHCADIFRCNIDPGVRARLFAGAIGTEYASQLEGFLAFYKDLPNPDQIIADPVNAEIPTGEPGKLWALCSALSERASETTIDAIITYANRLGEQRDAGHEFSVALVCDSVRKDPRKLAQGKAFIDWSALNHDVLI